MRHHDLHAEFRSLRRASLLSAAVAVIAMAAPPAAAQNRPAPSGEQVFNQSQCAVCHGKFGNGGAGPAFRNSRILHAGDYVVAQIIIGRGIMPAFGNKLNDQEIAAVASYIRNSWGNHFGPVSAKTVAQVRTLLQQEHALAEVTGTNGSIPSNSIAPAPLPETEAAPPAPAHANQAAPPPAPPPPGHAQAQSPDPDTAVQAKKALNGAGFDAGPADPNWGVKAETALRDFQQAHGLPATGQLDNKTLSALGLPQAK